MPFGNIGTTVGDMFASILYIQMNSVARSFEYQISISKGIGPESTEKDSSECQKPEYKTLSKIGHAE